MANGDFDILMRRGPRWAWNELDSQMSSYIKILEAFAPIDADFQDALTNLKNALNNIEPMGPKTISLSASVISESEIEAAPQVFKPNVVPIHGTVSSDSKQQARMIRKVQEAAIILGYSTSFGKLKVRKKQTMIDILGSMLSFNLLGRSI